MDAAAAPGAQQVAGIARIPSGLLVIYDLEQFLSLDDEARLAASLDQ